MSADGISSLVISIIALAISGLSIYISIKSDIKKSISSFRIQFFENLVKNNYLIESAKIAAKLGETECKVAPSLFGSIHQNLSCYLKDISFLQVADSALFECIHSFVVSADDASVLAVQHMKDKKDCKENVKSINNNLKELFKLLNNYFVAADIKTISKK